MLCDGCKILTPPAFLKLDNEIFWLVCLKVGRNGRAPLLIGSTVSSFSVDTALLEGLSVPAMRCGEGFRCWGPRRFSYLALRCVLFIRIQQCGGPHLKGVYLLVRSPTHVWQKHLIVTYVRCGISAGSHLSADIVIRRQTALNWDPH